MTMFAGSGILRGAACVIATGLLATSRLAERTDSVLPNAGAGRIAFASRRDANWEIYLADGDGAHQTRLTRRDPQDRFPLWSPDGSRIAFASQVGGDHWELWVMNVDGSNPRQLAAWIIPKGHRQWSSDGTRILFAANVDGDAEIFSVEVASGRLVRLTHSPGENADPSWSPDDRRIVFSSAREANPDIYVMNADGTQVRRLTKDAAADGPAWSPDGSTIAFASTRDGDRDIYLARLDDGTVERLTTGAHATKDGVRWSPNGSFIAVQTAQRDNYDIQLVRMADRKRTTVAGTPAYDGQFSWSSTGDQLAFISGRDGFDALYVTDLGGKAKRLTATASLNPEWSP
jgi:Tol biopolymer transport system component